MTSKNITGVLPLPYHFTSACAMYVNLAVVNYVVYFDEVALQQIFPEQFGFPLYYSISAPYQSIIRLILTLLNLNNCKCR
jgi:phosphate starvation-inducible membrane PsiE